MPGNVNNQNSASKEHLMSRDPAIIEIATNGRPNYSSPNFRGSTRVSHRRSQFNDDQNSPQVTNTVYRNSRVTTDGHHPTVPPQVSHRRSQFNVDQNSPQVTNTVYRNLRVTTNSHHPTVLPRVSHRRSQFNDDQNSPQVTNTANRNSRGTTNSHHPTVPQWETGPTSNPRVVGFSGQNGRQASFDGDTQFVRQFETLEITNRKDQRRKHETNKPFVYPQNFRDLELYPTKEDISRPGIPLLEPNKIKGAYQNPDHYLNVQFRLCREDFVASVRKGVQQYRDSSPSKPSQRKYDGIRIYPRAQFERVQSTRNNKLGVLLNFDPEGTMKSVKWKESKRFMFGSLLLFTIDNFSTFFLCTVIERDIDALRSGKILVSLTEKVRTDPFFFKRPFLMAECDAFFDPYFLVMKLLREFDENTFPMTRYIVQGATDHRYPTYVSDFGVLKVYNRIIAPITLDNDEWPTANEMQLDQYQFRAFKAALTRDFCVIQGPPGTGKTFIGLKIVQSIWHNAKSFNHKLQLPILVVCSANHAVDQFLEGVLKFTKNVVRVGGQSRSEIMKKYNLRERVRTETKFCSDKVLRGKIRSCQRDVDKIGLLMRCAEKTSGILSAKDLSDVVGPRHKWLVRDDKSLVDWLLPSERLGKRYDEQAFQKFKSKHEIKKPAKKPEVDQFEEDEDDDDGEDEESYDPEQKTCYEVEDGSCYSISLRELIKRCLTCIERYEQLKKNFNKRKSHNISDDDIYYKQSNSCKNDIIRFMKQFDNLNDYLNMAVHNEEYCREKQLFEKDPSKLDYKQRWRIYWQWTSDLVAALSKELEGLETSHSESVQLFEESKLQQDLEVMQKADVVGMTTSGAARLNSLLKLLHPAVVVIEEAGEVLETHVIASLTNKCQHVILIGDHEQLRPITAVYELSKTYHMNVSLFERLVKNGMDCPVLNVQHRMRPEISCLISPLIYKDLKNHESVLNFESIRGVAKNVFFVDHNEFENTMADNCSKQNEYEAKFIVHLTMYLIQQQYDPTKITILATYSAQRNLLRNLLKQYSVDNHVRCVVVDKYQGEENDIVLLSLVRSNADGIIGFLDTKNRVCVALSRAKKGFYMIGNMSCLARKCSLWQNIRQTLTNNEAIGTKLPLYCSIHGRYTFVASVDDFASVKNGGCGAPCNQLLRCGHICPAECHYTSGIHPEIKCCQTVSKTLRPCGHKLRLECSKDPSSVKCNECSVRGQSSMARNYSQDLSSLRSYGSSSTLLRHSYGFAPTFIVPKRRSFFSRCCLL